MSSFEQNGWLAVAAETGVLGLICFCWLVLDYTRIALHKVAVPGGSPERRSIEGVGGFAALCAACAANVFSSVHYNGVLIVFVLALALIGRPEGVCDDYKNPVPMAS